MICIKLKNRVSLYLSFMLVLFTVKQQAQITINGSAIININGGVLSQPSYLVLNSVGTTPVTTIGTTGGIMMESEYNVTRWIEGTIGTSINLPYYSNNSGSGVQFPLSVTNMNGAVGTATASLQFSSKNAVQGASLAFTSGWDNVNYLPTGVANMNGWNASIYAADNSANAIDRFWIIDQFGYTTTPSCTLSFGFVNAEANVNGSNTAGLANFLAAEPYDLIVPGWANAPTGNYPQGIVSNTSPTGTVSGVPVSVGTLSTRYRSWTLVSNISPLPVDLLSFSGTCSDNNSVYLKWSTSVEINSSYFTIEKSMDGQNFNWLANINAIGNSTLRQDYSYVDVKGIPGSTYYRLSETDKNGSEKIFNIITINGCNQEDKETINVYPSDDGNIIVNVYSLFNQTIPFTVYDLTGRLVYTDELIAAQGKNSFIVNLTLATAIYVVKVQTNTIALTKQVPILNK
jgi:hypothetical protein